MNEIIEVFGKMGKIKNIDYSWHFENSLMCFLSIEYETSESVELAIKELNEAKLDAKVIKVYKA